MDPNALIEAYVEAVARQLPGKMRADVAFELRDLLTQDLAQKAQALGRPADQAMAFELLDAFGRPEDVAARYHTPWAVIDPADTRNFILAVIVVSLAGDGLRVAGMLRGYGGPASLTWIGLMVVVFAIKSWAQRTWPEKHQWRPRSLVDHDRVNRVGLVLGIVMTVVAMVVYAAPGRVIDHLFGGRIPTFDLVYTDNFTSLRSFRMPGLFILMTGYALILSAVALHGRWRRVTRWMEILFLTSIAAQFGWHARIGEIFVSDGLDHLARRALALASALLLVDVAFKIYREWGRIRSPKEALADDGLKHG